MEATSQSLERTVVDIGATVEKHSQIVSQLPAVHPLTGCDTVAFMFGIGKATGLRSLIKGMNLIKLGNVQETWEDIVLEATNFVGDCYGSKGKRTMSQIRYGTWQTKTGNRKVTTAPKLRSLPPTTEAFTQNVKRAHLIWKAALQQDPPDVDPTDYGWEKDELNKALLPISVPSDTQCAPSEVLRMICCGCSADPPCSTTRCSCSQAQISCTPFCQCYAEGCRNKWTKEGTGLDDNDADDDEMESA
jgi:hypothetical protein